MQRQDRPLPTIQKTLTNVERLLNVLIDAIKANTAMLASQKDQLDVNAACKYLGISQRHLYRLTGANVLPYSKPTGKKLYFQRRDLDEYMRCNVVESNGQIDAEALDRFAELQRKGGHRPKGS